MRRGLWSSVLFRPIAATGKKALVLWLLSLLKYGPSRFILVIFFFKILKYATFIIFSCSSVFTLITMLSLIFFSVPTPFYCDNRTGTWECIVMMT